MRSPKISVVTISYNSAATIERTIQSVVSQDYQNKEYVIVDGLSTDNTMDIVNKYRSQIDCVISEKDTGISNAFNKGISRASGELIVLINSDDYLLPGILSTAAELWDGNIEILSFNYLAESGGRRFRIKPSLDFPTMPFFRKVVHQGRFIAKSLYVRIGMYDEKIKYPMDLDFLMRAYRNNATFQYVDKDAAIFTLGGATDSSIFMKKKDYFRVVRNNGGNLCQAFILYLFLILTQETKRLLMKTGCDIVRELKYEKPTV